MFTTILISILLWAVQAFVAGIINEDNSTRIPTGIFDFFRLTFLPYIIFCKIFKSNLLN